MSAVFLKRKYNRYRKIIMTAVMALALLISKVLDKARELSAKFFEKETVQPITEPNEGITTEIKSQTGKTPKPGHSLLKESTVNLSAQKRELPSQMQTTEQETLQIPPKPVMSAEAAAKIAYSDYWDKAENWKEKYSEKVQRQEESVYKRLQDYKDKNAEYQSRQSSKGKDKGAW